MNGGIAYRDAEGQLKTFPGLPGIQDNNQEWYGMELDPLDGSRAWAVGRDGQVFHFDTNGTIIQSIADGHFGKSYKWLTILTPGL